MAYTPTSSVTLNVNYTARPDYVTFVGSAATSPTPNQKPDPLFLIGGLPAATTTAVGGVTKVTAPATVSGSAGGTYTATEQGIINSLVTQYNAMRTALINSGIMS